MHLIRSFDWPIDRAPIEDPAPNARSVRRRPLSGAPGRFFPTAKYRFCGRPRSVHAEAAQRFQSPVFGFVAAERLDRIVFLCQSSFFFRQIGDLRFAFEQRGCVDFAASRENDSLSRNIFPSERGHRESRFLLLPSSACSSSGKMTTSPSKLVMIASSCFGAFTLSVAHASASGRQSFLYRLRRGLR